MGRDGVPGEEEELVPQRIAVYAPPQAIPRETDHRTLQMKRVQLAPEIDWRRQPTRMLRRGPAPQLIAPPRRRARGLWIYAALGMLLGAVAWGGLVVYSNPAQVSELALRMLPMRSTAAPLPQIEGPGVKAAVLNAAAPIPEVPEASHGTAVSGIAVNGAITAPSVALPAAGATLQPAADGVGAPAEANPSAGQGAGAASQLAPAAGVGPAANGLQRPLVPGQPARVVRSSVARSNGATVQKRERGFDSTSGSGTDVRGSRNPWSTQPSRPAADPSRRAWVLPTESEAWLK